MTQLPEKFSDGIRLAVADMKKCAKSSRYKINMGIWHRPSWKETNKGLKETCEVCMGGAVMAKSLKVPAKVDLNPYGLELPKAIMDKILAFDWLRTGDIYQALGMYKDRYIPRGHINVPGYVSYGVSPAKFYKWCFAVADALEKIGE